MPLLHHQQAPLQHRTTSLTFRRGQVQRNLSFPPPVQLAVLASAVIFVAINLFFLYHFVWIPSSSSSLTSSSTSSSSSSSLTGVLQSNQKQQHSSGVASGSSSSSHQASIATAATAATAGPLSSCEFREYPPHRYYQLTHKGSSNKENNKENDARDFLTKDAIYIYGEWPILLPIDNQETQKNAHQVKLCVHQEEWRRGTAAAKASMLLPFADGTNPSILSMSRFQKQATASNRHLDFVQQLIQNQQHQYKNKTIHWLATVCMTNSQCIWNDSPADTQRFKLNVEQEKPDTVRTMILLLNAKFETLGQATVHLQRDAAWGKRGQVKALSLQEQQDAEQQQQGRKVFAFDDARLFLHHGQLWISYREGKLYGYDTQVLNPVHLQWNNIDSSSKSSNNNDLLSFTATIRASESATLCCGRNMALMEQQPEISSSSLPPLQALTWVDPITVVEVDTTPFLQQQKQQQQQQQQHKQRRLLQQQESDESTIEIQQLRPPFLLQDVHLIPKEQQQRRRRLAQKQRGEKKSSHIHGTNAFMVYWPQENVFLGMGHYHRPNDRETNEYARFGHHYTHTLFAVKQSSKDNGDNNNNMNNDYYLQALSPEFVIPSFHHADDAEVIQFASGLEIDDDQQKLVIGYGINDCEAAVVTMDLAKVKTLLRPVPTGLQVVDLMQPLLQVQRAR